MDILKNLPDSSGAVVILSGGLDSTIATRLCVEKYGSENVSALTFDYGQKQRVEIERAKESTSLLGVFHKVLDLSPLNEIAMGFSANVDPNIKVPDLNEVLGHPQPVSYIPYRNMILLSLAASFAETRKLPTIVCGLQTSDIYSYWDTTPAFVGAINDVICQNRMFVPHVIAPFINLSKAEELNVLRELDGNLSLLKHTLTCYNPDSNGRSCGKCASCRDRLNAFKQIGEKDPIEYQE